MQKLAQIFLSLYGLILIVGGVKGYQAGSNDSLYIGGGSGAAALLLALLSRSRPRVGLGLGTLISAVLTGVMGWRFEKTGKLMPAGMIAVTSLLATGIGILGTLNAKPSD